VAHDTIDISLDGPYTSEIREHARFWGYGLTIEALERVRVSGAYGALTRRGRRKS
jgi:hypothetical protein